MNKLTDLTPPPILDTYIINATRLSPAGTKVVIVRQPDASGVVLVDNGQCVHSCRIENLTDTTIIVEPEIIIEKEKDQLSLF